MTRKPTLYELLDVPADATAEAIRTAWQARVDALHAGPGKIDAEDLDYRIKLLNTARDTLVDPMLRAAYDSNLADRAAAETAGGAADSGLALLPMASTSTSASPQHMAQRVDALALKADALAIKAEALALKADLDPRALNYGEPPSMASRMASDSGYPIKRILMIVGVVAASWMVIQTLITYSSAKKAVAVRQAIESAQSSASQAEEKIIVEEYYQKYGVRPASAAEARLLERERRREEDAAREEERAKKRAEDEARRFEQDSRREAERVSADLRRAEESAKREEEYARRQREEAERRAQEAERMRIEQKLSRMRAELDRDR